MSRDSGQSETNKLLVILAEEASEVCHAACKILRVGETYKDRDYVANLESEIGDLLAMVNMLHDRGAINYSKINRAVKKRLEKMERYGLGIQKQEKRAV